MIIKITIKDLKKIDRRYRQQIEQAIIDLSKGDVKKMKNQDNDFRLKVGRYRELFSMDSTHIIIHTVKPRSDAYK
ncbi:type II toxin-antitoxin system RelE/ParE family toxin [Candidatus Ruthia endofausta]|uniref:Type II toxin-antitoxin system RelE/ParE family toxin n=1 Tax=Candidatus Ruthia endofausta TaxID=2738852 RepID=A0A6N0HPU9_9GAMM|nr:type II toxin-antitoxin system RelE/ParE family toxin [Candidatus Ruthia endofausta]QKQ24270.1 type II toxin-antitoxin system RelE/ParE family toxin [Candidatus Ruthia endofausta]